MSRAQVVPERVTIFQKGGMPLSVAVNTSLLSILFSSVSRGADEIRGEGSEWAAELQRSNA
jgi:hypothetical protein